MKSSLDRLLDKGKGVVSSIDEIRLTPKNLILLSIAIVAFFTVLTLVFFFAFVDGEEQVMVPNVMGKSLSEALVEMQVKELYPKLVLQYSDNPFDKGRVLNQEPLGGVITKAGKRITLTVSQGPILANVEDYIGKNINDVQLHIQTIFPDVQKALLTVDTPLYVYSDKSEGTIIEQHPLPESPIVDRTPLKFVVSRGSEHVTVDVPNLVGMTVDRLYAHMEKTQLEIDFSTRIAQADDAFGTVVSQLPEAQTTINRSSRMGAVIAVPSTKSEKMIYGVATTDLPEYPYPLTITVDIVGESGEKEKLTTFRHSGGSFSFPYSLSAGTIIIFSIGSEEIYQTIVE
ncbi:MAG: PASTA domain-containing protein [Treponemataceae bacterium]